MGRRIKIATSRTQTLRAYLATPDGTPRGGIVVIQEIYGLTPHIRSVVDRLADAGYTAAAPAFFDRIEPNTVLNYDRGGTSRGKALVTQLGMQWPLEDVAATAKVLALPGQVGSVGFCWGGTVALLAAQQLGLPSVSYYGARNVGYLDAPLKAPVQFHFGGKDDSIPREAIAAHRKQWPDMDVFMYPDAGHAFNRDRKGDRHYHAASAALAWERSMAFFEQQLHEPVPDLR